MPRSALSICANQTWRGWQGSRRYRHPGQQCRHPGGSIDKIDEAWRHAWELKVFGYINLTRAIYAQMNARGAALLQRHRRSRRSSTPTTGLRQRRQCGADKCSPAPRQELADNIRVVGINPALSVPTATSPRSRPRANQFGDENRHEFRRGSRQPPRMRGDRRPDAFLASDRAAIRRA